jgi:DNA-binding transcriptional ArsR family regulator
MSTGKKKLLSSGQLDAVARLFGVLSEPSRLALLQALYGGPLKVSELMQACEMRQANVSKHLGVLHDHRLVKRQRNGTSIQYEIADPMIFALCNLVCGKMERDAKCAAALFQVGDT